MIGHAYASSPYAATLAHAGRPIHVAAWGSMALLRDIPGGGGRLDAMGPYPVCVLAPDADISAGLQALQQAGAVSVVLVADPVAGPQPAVLACHFPLCRPFKTHHVIDRRLGPADPSKHHRDRIRRGRRHATARLVDLRDPAWLHHWCGLYAGLVEKRGITGLQAFPAASFHHLSQLPAEQLLAFAAQAADGAVLAMQLWVRDGQRAYSHFTATSEAGYRLGASYVVYAAAIEHLADCELLDLGGGAGADDQASNPLAMFKAGFANATLQTRLCGAVLDPGAYAALAAGHQGGDFFPAYRNPLGPRSAQCGSEGDVGADAQDRLVTDALGGVAGVGHPA